MAAVYGIFFAEVAAYRIGTKKLAKLGVDYSMFFLVVPVMTQLTIRRSSR